MVRLFCSVMATRYVIIGGGIAGVSCAEQVSNIFEMVTNQSPEVLCKVFILGFILSMVVPKLVMHYCILFVYLIDNILLYTIVIPT